MSHSVSDSEAGGYHPHGERLHQNNQTSSTIQGVLIGIFHIVPKKDCGYWPILDLSGLDKFLKFLPYHMQHVADHTKACRDCSISVELKDAYFNGPTIQLHRWDLCFAFHGPSARAAAGPIYVGVRGRQGHYSELTLSHMWNVLLMLLIHYWIAFTPTTETLSHILVK